MNLKEKIRSVPGWPIDPVTFRDITTLLQDPEAFQWTCDQFYRRYQRTGVEKVVGIDALHVVRGFGATFSGNYVVIGNCSTPAGPGTCPVDMYEEQSAVVDLANSFLPSCEVTSHG